MKSKRLKLQDLMDAMETAVYWKADNKPIYVDNKPTGGYESTVITALTRGIGEFFIKLPYQEGLADKLNEKYPSAELFSVAELVEIEDVIVSVYDGSLRVNFMASLKK